VIVLGIGGATGCVKPQRQTLRYALPFSVAMLVAFIEKQ
jgi:hypothetical protein